MRQPRARARQLCSHQKLAPARRSILTGRIRAPSEESEKSRGAALCGLCLGTLCCGGGRRMCLKYMCRRDAARVIPGLSPVFAECHLDATAALSPSPPPPSPSPLPPSPSPPPPSPSPLHERARAAGRAVMNVSIVHISDTHGRHADLVLPSAQMLIHTGDFCEHGTDAEWESFNLWLGEIKPNYRWIFVIMGNHDYKFLDGLAASDELIETLASDETRRAFLQARLSNAVVLDNEQLEVPVGEHSELRLKLFASAWSPWQSSPTHVDKVALPGGRAVTDHDRVFEAWSSKLAPGRNAAWTPGEAFRYDELPPGIDILLTHVAPLGVLDRMPVFGSWGSSGPLLVALERAAPRAHLFGHVHAQRGYWEKTSLGSMIGGVQYAKTTDDTG